jgi:hypothetical protein
MPYLFMFLILAVLIVLALTYWYYTVGIIAIVIIAITLPKIIRRVRMRRYFASEEFLKHKNEVAVLVAEHNAIATYACELRTGGSFDLGASSTGSQAHLATFANTSRHGYRRDRNVATYGSSNVHNCSLQVVRNAAGSPIKYLMKYFDIPATEESLGSVESLGEQVSRLESAVENLTERERAITNTVSPPPFIAKRYAKEFMDAVGVELAPIEVPYLTYAFEYVSAGGNSGQRTDIKLDTPTIDALVETIGERIRFRKSAAGQRAMMTTRLREAIKRRDSYTCQYCSVSVSAEPHLLLEIDHIVPVSKGGLSMESNLQTLCWRCNRSKSNKDAPRNVGVTTD